MPRFSPELMEGFIREMQKEALSPGKVLGYATGTGAAMGGLWKGVGGYQEARERGESRTDALRSAARSGAKGALGGAAVGGALGGVHYARGGKGFTMPESVPLVGGKVVDPGKSLAEFGGHMGHIWTGRGTASQWGAGAAATKKQVDEAQKALRTASSAPAKDTRWLASHRAPMSQEALNSRAAEKAQKTYEAAQKRHTAMQASEKAGLTNIPDTVKGLVRRPGETLGAFKNYVTSMSGAEKAFTLGMPAAFGAVGALAPEEGQSRLGGALSGAASGVPWAMPWMPKSLAMSLAPGAGQLMPQMALSAPLEASGRAVGNVATSGYNRLAGNVAAPEERQY